MTKVKCVHLRPNLSTLPLRSSIPSIGYEKCIRFGITERDREKKNSIGQYKDLIESYETSDFKPLSRKPVEYGINIKKGLE